MSICKFRNKLSRLIKLTIIDAIVDLDIDDTDFTAAMLQMFVSKNESDNFVRDYAKEQVVKLIPATIVKPIVKPRQPGSAKGQVWISDDFDRPLEEFKEYME